MVGFGFRVVVVLLLVLAGCSGGGSGSGSQAAARGIPSVQVMSKTVTIAAPKGFCVDEGAIRETSAGAFVMLGSCAAISGNRRDTKPRTPAVLTASVAPAGAALDSEGLDRLASYFTTKEGRSALARSEGTGEATVLDLTRDENLVLVHARDGARQGDIAGDYWRGVFSLAGHLVTITVSGFLATPLDDTTGGALARDFAKAIRRANETEPGRSPGTGNAGLASFFNRLL